jgi:hypothetical protein
MPDLFISYSSHDRRWAERLYNDLRERFPTIRLFWDRDQGSIPPESNWADVLKENAKNATHFAVFWSEKAKASDYVGPEIQAFEQNRETHPTHDGTERRLFYIPLEGEYGPLEAIQGFADLRQYKTYSATAEDRGLSNLEINPHRGEWARIVGIIGDTVLAAEPTQPIKLALLVMNEDDAKFLINSLLGFSPPGGPTLQDFLDAVGLTAAAAKKRYGKNAFSWRPFGTAKTIIDLMEDLRETTNRSLKEYRFHWIPWDLVATAREVKSDVVFREHLDRLAEGPSAVVVDPISLFHPMIRLVFGLLEGYTKKEHSIIISLSPNEAPALDRLYQALRTNGAPVLDGYFLPPVPATETFARCGMNVQHVMQLEGLIRGSLGVYYRQQKKAEGKSLTSAGG